MKRRPVARLPAGLALLLLSVGTQAGADEIFDITEFAVAGRVVTAQAADFNGDARKDLMVASLDGVPPAERRTIHIYLQREDGSLPERPSHELPIPDWSAVYDIADLTDTPGEELVLLRPDGVTIVSLARPDAPQWHIPVSGPSTVAAGDDERGFDRYTLVYDDFGDTPRILVPQIGAMAILGADGRQEASLRVGRRANYFVTRSTGLISVESDIQLFLDVPKISVGDVDGDGGVDIVASTRHEIRVFLRQPDGGFEPDPSYSVPLSFISALDHSRGSGSIVTTVRDIDDDERLDLMISHVEGTFIDTVTTTYVYRNRNGLWDIDNPDDTYVADGTLSSDLLFDTDEDGTLELVRIQLKFSILEVVELLLTRKIDVRVFVYRLQDDGRYSDKPWSKKKISTAISFDTFRPKGFMPTSGIDLNDDGIMDFVMSDDGKGIEVYLGSRDGLFGRRSAVQKLDTAGRIQFEDYDGDGLPDFILYTPQSFDTVVKIGRNRGNFD